MAKQNDMVKIVKKLTTEKACIQMSIVKEVF